MNKTRKEKVLLQDAKRAAKELYKAGVKNMKRANRVGSYSNKLMDNFKKKQEACVVRVNKYFEYMIDTYGKAPEEYFDFD